MTPEEDAKDRALLAYLLDGRRPELRRASGRNRHQGYVERPVDPAELDPYDLLIWEQAPHLSRAELVRLVWDWSALLTPRDARAWFAAGAGVSDLEIVRQFHDAGILPDLAGRGVLRLGRPTGWTFLQMVRAGRMTAEEVRTIIGRPHPGRASGG